MSDSRWRRLAFEQQKPVTVFKLQAANREPSDSDFRVGLQLLIGMLDEDVDS
jgi:soluble cytochrome b562